MRYTTDRAERVRRVAGRLIYLLLFMLLCASFASPLAGVPAPESAGVAPLADPFDAWS